MERQLNSRLAPGSKLFRPRTCTEISNLKHDMFEDSLSVMSHLINWKADDAGKLLLFMENYSDDEIVHCTRCFGN